MGFVKMQTSSLSGRKTSVTLGFWFESFIQTIYVVENLSVVAETKEGKNFEELDLG